ncbi:MAG: hypothetical protein K8I27_14170 [Planctomycetes bacterium]|nr:hypothetical protein [Planctomycetota bacterium]
MKVHPLPLLFAVVMAIGVAACSSPQVIARQVRESQPYEIRVKPLGVARVSKDGFDSRFEFEVVSLLDLNRNSLVQELYQKFILEYRDGSTRERTLTLVEAFRLRFSHRDAAGRYHYRIWTGQSDRHSMRGIDDLSRDVVAVTIERTVFAYVANVAGAHFTPAGFAHLPKNEDGSVVSNVPSRFNENYQQNYETRGLVRNSGDSLGLTYEIRYRLVRESERSPQFSVLRGGGWGVVQSPVIVRQGD